MPDIVLITALTNPVSKQTERWSISGVVFTEVALANIEAKKSVDRELPLRRSGGRTWRRSHEQENHI